MEFEDENRFPVLKPRSIEQTAADLGIPVSNGTAQFIIVSVAALMIAAAVYLFIAAVPEPPVLDDDVPRKGEVIPKNRTI